MANKPALTTSQKEAFAQKVANMLAQKGYDLNDPDTFQSLIGKDIYFGKNEQGQEEWVKATVDLLLATTDYNAVLIETNHSKGTLAITGGIVDAGLTAEQMKRKEVVEEAGIDETRLGEILTTAERHPLKQEIINPSDVRIVWPNTSLAIGDLLNLSEEADPTIIPEGSIVMMSTDMEMAIVDIHEADLGPTNDPEEVAKIYLTDIRDVTSWRFDHHNAAAQKAIEIIQRRLEM